MLKLYNTLTKKKEEFKPIKKGEVKMYSCGPTVYWYPHIGNLRSYIFSDILKRVLKYNGFKVKQVMNVTDVGHLTSDSDTGEDKIEKAAKKEHKSAQQIANYYWKIFKQDFKKLNITEPDIWSKATEHIKEQINMIKKIEQKGYTYKTSDGIYFDTTQLRDYGKLARLKKKQLNPCARISMREKKHATDFALWKFSKEPGKRQQEWKSPWGLGFPGWHIECSVMSLKYLGNKFDIHTGGEDHISIHHPNEMAQNYAYLGKRAVNFWMHGAFLTHKGEKISKSKGGLYTLSELEKMKFKPLSYRYFTFTAHYKKQLNFTLDNLRNAQNSYERLKNIITEIKDDKKTNKSYLKKFQDAINNDLDMPSALSILWNLIRDKKAQGKIKTIKKMGEVFGLNLLTEEKLLIPKEIKKLAEERERARRDKNYKQADALREEIKKAGYYIDDTEKGAKIKKL